MGGGECRTSGAKPKFTKNGNRTTTQIYSVLSWPKIVTKGNCNCLFACKHFIEYAAIFVIHLLAEALVRTCVISKERILTPLLKLKPLAYIGTISFGMDMLHMLRKSIIVKTRTALRFSGNGIEIFILTVFAAIVIASLSFRYFESYCLNLKTRLEHKFLLGIFCVETV